LEQSELEILMSKSGLVMQTAVPTVNPWTHSYRVENSDEDNRPDEADMFTLARGSRPNNGRATGGRRSYYSERGRRSPSPEGRNLEAEGGVIMVPANEGEPGNQSTIQAHSTISKDETGGMEAVERKLLMILASKYFPVW
jgi:hypothetical protein